MIYFSVKGVSCLFLAQLKVFSCAIPIILFLLLILAQLISSVVQYDRSFVLLVLVLLVGCITDRY